MTNKKRNSTRLGVRIASRHYHKAKNKNMGNNVISDGLESTQRDLPSLQPYKLVKKHIQSLCSSKRKNVPELTYGAIARQLEPAHKQYLSAVLLDLAESGVLRWSPSSPAPSKVTIIQTKIKSAKA